ncbi:MAG: thioredoxin-disulfide reductase [Bdellovibrionales bacterium RIFOXYD1_FULL_53_11]|nr:MAG: thioredoxin-disulfide reductase [Bdellovibrionales bacterium RIFOXYD1_FULL_53_11]
MSDASVEALAIIGSGPAGLTAAVYAARANRKPVVIEGMQPGGQLTITSEVENFPGFPESVTGPELMDRMRAQAQRFGTRFLQGEVENVDFSRRPFLLELRGGAKVRTRSLIIAVGAYAKWLGIPSEARFKGKGVSACATCDGFFFRGMDVAVVGGGDTAMEEALFLTHFAKTVTVIHRRDALRASKAMQDKAFANSKIRFEWDSAVEEILGDKAVDGLRLRNIQTGAVKDIAVKGVFMGIGHEPNTGVFRRHLDCDGNGYIKVQPGTTRTSVEGVYAAGDATDPVYRQAVTAAAGGCMAAIDADRCLGC